MIFVLTGGTGTLAGVAPASADDSSAVTVAARDQDTDIANAPFPDLKVTVSQTRGLEAQGIVVSWTGGKSSTVPNQQIGGANFLQVFQCWGDEPGDEPRPDRTTCQYGLAGVPGSGRDAVRFDAASVAAPDAEYTVTGDGFSSPTSTAIPFRSFSGKTVASIVESKYNYQTDSSGTRAKPDVNSNEFFTRYTTNMIPWAGSGGDGSGSVKFEVQTALQSQGLGCGAPVEGADGAVTGKSCWLVVLPRGERDSGAPFITQSGLFWDAWKHRVAIKLDFNTLGLSCPLGAAERQLAGSELIARAVASWRPAVCAQAGGGVYTAITSAESDAVAAAAGTAAAPLALTSRALQSEPGQDPLAYAPIGVTGAAISFAIDRNPRPSDASVPTDAAQRSGLPFTQLKLTPRLVAKLLTNSYLDSLPTFADRSHLGTFTDTGKRTDSGEVVMKASFNPRNLTTDPDFLAVNDPEWKYQALSAASLADALVPQGRSDAAWAIWQYVQGDKDAREFLAGTPDPWGMKVNPWSATTDRANMSGTATTLPREDFPKADPVEQAATKSAGPVNLVTWRPYVNDLETGAYDTLRGDGLTLGDWDPNSIPPKFGKADRNLPGRQTVLAVTDTASAARYQVVTAALRNPAGEFVTATPDSMAAAAAAMTADPRQPQVYGFDPASAQASAARSAYPLTMPVYAAANPAMADADLRAGYAAFIRYAATTGQNPGTAVGQLPPGYVPLPQGWSAQALAAATTIAAGVPAAASGDAGAAVEGVPFPAASSAAASPTETTASADAATPQPTASGSPARALNGPATADDPDLGGLPAALPASLLGGIASGLCVPLFGRLRRRL